MKNRYQYRYQKKLLVILEKQAYHRFVIEIQSGRLQLGLIWQIIIDLRFTKPKKFKKEEPYFDRFI